MVPVLRIHKSRTSDTRQVEVDVLRLPAKITTGQASLSLYQEEPVTDKVLPRSLRIGVFAKDDTPLSEIRTVDFDSTDPEARLRESTVVLTLAHNPLERSVLPHVTVTYRRLRKVGPELAHQPGWPYHVPPTSRQRRCPRTRPGPGGCRPWRRV